MQTGKEGYGLGDFVGNFQYVIGLMKKYNKLREDGV